jgi:hypothetical protein
MAIPSFLKLRRGDEADDADPPAPTSPAEGTKETYAAVDRSPSFSSVNSDEKQTFGVSKVEAVTTVWTKNALITLYIL